MDLNFRSFLQEYIYSKALKAGRVSIMWLGCIGLSICSYCIDNDIPDPRDLTIDPSDRSTGLLYRDIVMILSLTWKKYMICEWHMSNWTSFSVTNSGFWGFYIYIRNLPKIIILLFVKLIYTTYGSSSP